MNILDLMRMFTIRFRMQSAIAVVLLLLGLLGSVGMWSMLRIHDLHNNFLQGPWQQAQRMEQLTTSLDAVRLQEGQVLMEFARGRALEDVYALWQTQMQQLTTQITAYQQGLDAAEQPQAQAVLAAVGNYNKDFAKILQDIREQPFITASEIYSAADASHAHLQKAEQQVKQLQTTLQQGAQAMQERGDAVAEQAKWLFVAAILVTLLVVGPLTWLNMLAICRPLSAAQKVADAIAQGDLTAPVDTAGKDELADLQRALEKMQSNLNHMVGQVRDASSSIALASQEIASGNADLSARTEQTASNLQQTVASLEQLTGTVQQTADSAGQANHLAAQASDTAGQGGTVVQEAVGSMQAIANASRRIGDIIGLIDSIAFQTNILALNAAVEAARAGEQGRGFAVVASEVRLLARRSADAASEIKQLIQASVTAVDGGVRNAEDAGNTMQGIVSSIERVVGMIREISATANEQSSGIAEVNQAVGHIDQMTQQNAALVEESAAAAQSLHDQAQRLAGVVGQFKLAAGAVPGGIAGSVTGGVAGYLR